MTDLSRAVTANSRKSAMDGKPKPPVIIGVIVMLLLCISCCCTAVAEMLPSGYQSWADTLGNGVTQFGGLIEHYPAVDDDDTTWTEINVNWEQINDTTFRNVRGVLEVFATASGGCGVRIKYKGHTLWIKQWLDRLVFIDTLEYRWQDLQTDLAWPEPVMAGRDLSWWFGQWGYRIRKGKGAVGNQIAFKPAALTWTVNQWEDLPAAIRPHVGLANVFKYEITFDGMPVADSIFLNDSLSVWKRLKKIGRMVIDFSRQKLHMSGHGQLSVPVYQHWTKRNETLWCAEYVMMNEIDSIHAAYPNKTLWHASTTTLNYTKMEDTYINSNFVDRCNNYGGADELSVRDIVGAADHVAFTRPMDVADNIGAGQIIDSAELYYNVMGSSVTSDSVGIYECFNPWREGIEDGAILPSGHFGALYEHWEGYYQIRGCVNGHEWGDPFAACARDAGEYNDNGFVDQDCVDSTADRKSTREDMIWVHKDSVDNYHKWRISGTLATKWYDSTGCVAMYGDGDIQPCGLAMMVQGSGEIDFISSSYVWTPNVTPPMPYYKFYHHTPAAHPPDVRSSPEDAGLRSSPSGNSVRSRP